MSLDLHGSRYPSTTYITITMVKFNACSLVSVLRCTVSSLSLPKNTMQDYKMQNKGWTNNIESMSTWRTIVVFTTFYVYLYIIINKCVMVIEWVGYNLVSIRFNTFMKLRTKIDVSLWHMFLTETCEFHIQSVFMFDLWAYTWFIHKSNIGRHQIWKR